MRNKEAWAPTKFVPVGDRWRGSRDPKELAVASRLIGDLMARRYQRAVEAYASGQLIDLGCGKVPLYGMYRSKVSHVICIDWKESRHGTDFVDHVMDMNSPLDLPEASFDTVLATDVLEHIRKVDLIWSEMARICKPGGHIIVGTPFFYWLHETPYDYARYTKYDLMFRCERNRLHIISLKEYGGAPEVLADLILKQFRMRGRLCAGLDATFRLILRLRACRRYSSRTKEEFPLGYCLVARKTGP
jgi:SAM-dependent methyltransferase